MRIPILCWLFLIPIFIVSVSGQCLPEQKSLLLQLKNNLTFNPSISTKLTNWNQTLDCCKWNGVTCDHNGIGHVTGLDLNSKSISDGIGYSSTLFSLRYLETLNLANNSFNSSPIPSSIGNLTNLVYLNLSNSGFSGRIPIELSFLTRLVTLDLSTLFFPPIHTLQIQNPNLSTLFGNLSGVKELHLDGVNISADGYDWGRAISSSLPNLRVLSLRSCFLSGPIDSSLTNLRYLSELNLASNNLSSVPEFFANFPNLTVLILSSSNLSGTFPDVIFEEVQTLQTLDLANNVLLNGSLPDFPENGSLRNLVLTDTSFSGNLPESIGNLIELRRIEIPGCYFSGPIPSSLANLSHLVYLDFSSNNFSGPIPSFKKSKNLTYIDLSHNTLTGVVLSTHFEGLSSLVYIDLASNSFNGSIPSSLFLLPSLQKILLSNNKFGGQITGFSNESLSPLDTLDLSSNKLEGPIPSHFFDFRRLNILSLSFNNFSGTVALESIQRLKNLTKLELSYNNLTVDVSVNISLLSSFPQLTVLRLASCNLRKFPALMNQSRVVHLDLSDNKISGVIPNWIWNVGDGKLMFLNLSCNLLVGLQSVYIMPRTLSVLDLHSNQLSGEIPVPPEAAIYVDYSGNKFNSSIPAEVGNGIASAIFFSLSDNMLSGPIPPSICNGSYLQVLDLSNNKFSGKIPQCLIDSRTETLGVLNLGNNNLSGNVSGTFRQKCALKTLDLSANKLEGQVSESLSNCTNLEVLNLGNNRMNGNFTCFLKNSSNLRVLVLRANGFQGGISCPEVNDSTWPKLQIIDLALNNFSGILPPKLFLQRKAMMDGGNAQPDLSHLRFGVFTFNKLYYQDSVTVINKGLEMKLVKILTIFTAIDFSNNSFEGELPGAIGALRNLYVLNLSRNALSGEIPSKLGKLTLLGSLDLSFNKLYGSIPSTLAGLTFLSFLNLSHNRLFGRIPVGTQLQSFSSTSFEGNVGLCGPPLISTCKDTPPEPFPTWRNKDSGSVLKMKFDWQFIYTGLGFGIGAGFVVGPVVFWKQGSRWCDKQIEKVVWIICPTVGLIFSCCGGVKVDTESKTEEEPETEDTDEEDGEDMEENAFPGRYCLFCSKLDIHRKKAIHDPNCSCHESPSFSSSSSSSSSCS